MAGSGREWLAQGLRELDAERAQGVKEDWWSVAKVEIEVQEEMLRKDCAGNLGSKQRL